MPTGFKARFLQDETIPLKGPNTSGFPDPPLTNRNIRMNKLLISIVSSTLLLAGCVSPQSQKALATLQAECNAGNRDSCTAAGYQAQANQQELNTNTAVASGVGAALLGAAIIGTVIAVDSNQPGYAPEHRGYHYR
jgi:hypothetical protein